MRRKVRTTARRAIRDGRRLSIGCKVASFFIALCIALVMVGVGQAVGPDLWKWVTAPGPAVKDFRITRATRHIGYVELYGWIDKPPTGCVFPGANPSVAFYMGDVEDANAPKVLLKHDWADRPEGTNVNRPPGTTRFGPWWIFFPEAVTGKDVIMWTFHVCNGESVPTMIRVGDARKLLTGPSGPIDVAAK